MVDVIFHDLGRMEYQACWDCQKQAHAQVLEGGPMRVLLVEHEPVVTIGIHPGAGKHLVASPEMLARHGVEVCQTDRGGDITYHGPGQLVVYPILRLNDLGLNVRTYVRLIEQSIIDVAAGFGVTAGRDEKAVGVWVGSGKENAKLAAIGVRIRRWVSMHGLALNVTTNLDHFKLIVPCGLTGRPVTSLQKLLGERCPSMERVKAAMAEVMREQIEGLGSCQGTAVPPALA